jgi:hypothetical protein
MMRDILTINLRHDFSFEPILAGGISLHLSHSVMNFPHSKSQPSRYLQIRIISSAYNLHSVIVTLLLHMICKKSDIYGVEIRYRTDENFWSRLDEIRTILDLEQTNEKSVWIALVSLAIALISPQC